MHKFEDYSYVFDEMLDGFALHEIICDDNGKPINYKFLAVNPAFEKMTGLRSKDIIGKTVLEVLPNTEKYWIENYGRVALTGKAVLFENFSIEINKYFEVKVFSPKDKHFATIISDITKNKEAEMHLAESEERFKTLHNASFGGIAIHDKGVILDCNYGLTKMTGYSYDELVGMDGLLLIAEHSRALVTDNILQGYEKPYEADGLKKNGTSFPMRLEARNIPFKGKMIRVVEFRDITENKLAEKALKDKIEELERFNEFSVGREIKMIELKKEINTLLNMQNMPPKYKIVE